MNKLRPLSPFWRIHPSPRLHSGPVRGIYTRGPQAFRVNQHSYLTRHQSRNMSNQRDLTYSSDISKRKNDGDGSFKRPPSSFREFIAKNGRFAPEKGEPISLHQWTVGQERAIAVGLKMKGVLIGRKSDSARGARREAQMRWA